ncbi:MAG TPA: hypothetical protein VND45_03265 [Thermoanaerobaculia bacterium]|jgi:hypothetical protein|nr:hypothetical protein [Thermoanaerobaculia bacterium]
MSIVSIDAGQQSRSRTLQELFKYPFMSCLAERRTRRVPKGVSLDAGPLSWTSKNEPEPLTKLEEAVLVASLGVTGVTTHDGPLVKPGGQELGTPFLHAVARTGSSADNCQATSFFLINDDGISLIRQPQGRAALELLRDLPPKWADWQEEDWIHAAQSVKVKVSDRRVDFPREYPYYLGWNAQMSNKPGTTLFFPVVDCTRQYINAIAILLSEPEGKRPVFIDDWQPFRPKTFKELLAWVAAKLGFVDPIPYQPIGGLKWIDRKFVNKNNAAPLGFGATLRTDYECFFYFQNLMLVGQALGLGGWIHGSVFPPYIYMDKPEKGWHGLGFRFQEPKKLRRFPPVPGSQPNPIGIDGILEGLTPPYVKSMDEAVDKVVDEKYGPSGNYGDVKVFSRAYNSVEHAEAYLKNARHFSKDAIAYTKDICNYLYDTYGRFPAHVDAYYSPGMWLQFSHLELEYYDRFYDPAQFARQHARAEWGDGERGGR